MKSLTNLRNSLFLGCLALGTLGLLAPSLTLAEGKGASKLMFAPATNQSNMVASSSAHKGCARCTDGYTRVADTAPKGIRAEQMRTIALHMCSSCQTKISTVGTGKAKTDKVVHSCGSGEASCCV